jgi:hypothetical protein
MAACDEMAGRPFTRVRADGPGGRAACIDARGGDVSEAETVRAAGCGRGGVRRGAGGLHEHLTVYRHWTHQLRRHDKQQPIHLPRFHGAAARLPRTSPRSRAAAEVPGRPGRRQADGRRAPPPPA